MLGKELLQEVSDTLTMANLMVAQATIYYRIYKFDEFTNNNLEAAKLYKAIRRADYELLSLVNALDGSILNNDKSLADSIWTIAKQRVRNIPAGKDEISVDISKFPKGMYGVTYIIEGKVIEDRKVCIE